MKAYVYTVTQITSHIKKLLESDILLTDVCVKAEISNFKAHTSGHMYFTLKDENAAISAVMFRGNTLGLKFMPENGMKVIVSGYISLYEKTGQYQLYVKAMEPAGKGALYLAYEQLKARLERSGVFDAKHKKPLPSYPRCIALVTSPTGAAVRDMIQISRRRNPNVELVVLPVLVQGENAAPDIARAIKEVNEWGGADLAIVGRGGGSIEDLWAFNEECVARAIFESNIPIISAVGHETDYTIADFVADMRAPTPSAAAELAVPESIGFREQIMGFNKRMNTVISRRLAQGRYSLENVLNTSVFKYPLAQINNNEIYVFELYKRLERSLKVKADRINLKLGSLTEGLERLSPLAIMQKGYSLVYNAEGSLIKSKTQLKNNDKISIRLADGKISARVEE